MKKYFLVICLLLSQISYSQDSDIISMYLSAGKHLGSKEKNWVIAEWLNGQIFKKLKKYLPCATITSQGDFAYYLEFCRQRELLGNPDENGLKAFSDALGARYLCVIDVSNIGQNYFLSTTLLDKKKNQAVIKKQSTATGPDDAIQACDGLADKFVFEMTELEICPYKGDIKVSLKETRDKKIERSTPLACPDVATYHLLSETNSTEDQTWTITKEGKESAGGYIQYKLVENYNDLEEFSNCYPCKSGRMAGRTCNKTTKVECSTNNLEQKDVAGMNAYMARAVIKFTKDSTFYLHVYAKSVKCTRTTTIREKIEGSCDTKPNNEDHNQQIDISMERILGPYPGCPRDKVLTIAKETKTEHPQEGVTVESTTEFTLTRK
jgi:hypothetical protein